MSSFNPPDHAPEQEAGEASAAKSIHLRRQEEKELRRQSIIDAAELLISDKTWAEVNFSDIAKITRLSRSLIYVYFPSKTDLFHAICNRGALILKQVFADALQPENSGLDNVEAIGRAYHRFSREQPIYFKLHAEQEALSEKSVPEGQPQSYSHPAFLFLSQAISQGLADGSIRTANGNVRLTALTLWTFTHGLLLITARKEDFLRERAQVDVQAMVDHGFLMMRNMLSGR